MPLSGDAQCIERIAGEIAEQMPPSAEGVQRTGAEVVEMLALGWLGEDGARVWSFFRVRIAGAAHEALQQLDRERSGSIPEPLPPRPVPPTSTDRELIACLLAVALEVERSTGADAVATLREMREQGARHPALMPWRMLAVDKLLKAKV